MPKSPPYLITAILLQITLLITLFALSHLCAYAWHRFRTRRKPQGFPLFDPH